VWHAHRQRVWDTLSDTLSDTYLRLFEEDTLVLIVPADELPAPYYPYVGGSIPVKHVGLP
jgi:hypothetical protein